MPNVKITNYEINQQAYANLAPLSKKMRKDRTNILLEGLTKEKIQYIGILCREKNDYTVIKINKQAYISAADTILEILDNRGDIIDIEKGKGFYEGWVRERRTESIDDLEQSCPGYKGSPITSMYAIFNANDGVIEVGEE